MSTATNKADLVCAVAVLSGPSFTLTLSRSQTVRSFALISMLASVAAAQTTAPAAVPYMNRNLVVLDPAHGGGDGGATIDRQPEKAITLSLAADLKALLIAQGFTVVNTREADLPATAPLLTNDQRAGIANHLRPVACVILHATGTGDGVHLFTSSLPPATSSYEPSAQLPWESAQTPFLLQSQRLANDLGLALARAKIAAVLSRTALRPLDNLTCPAIAIEVAPLRSGQKSTSPDDGAYQQRLASTLAAAILAWRDVINPRPAPKAAQSPGASPGATP